MVYTHQSVKIKISTFQFSIKFQVKCKLELGRTRNTHYANNKLFLSVVTIRESNIKMGEILMQTVRKKIAERDA